MSFCACQLLSCGIELEPLQVSCQTRVCGAPGAAVCAVMGCGGLSMYIYILIDL